MNEPSYFGLTNDHTWLSVDAEYYKKLKPTHRMKCYTHPVKELNDGGEPVKNATYWKRQYNLMATQNDNLKSGLYHANEQIKYLESHPVKELTDVIETLEHLLDIADNGMKEGYKTMNSHFVMEEIKQAILEIRKAQEK